MKISEFQMFDLKSFLFKERSFTVYNFSKNNKYVDPYAQKQAMVTMRYPPIGYVAPPGAIQRMPLVRKLDAMKKELIETKNVFNLYDESFNCALTGFNMHTDRMVKNPSAQKKFQINKTREIHLPMYFNMGKNKFYHTIPNDIESSWKTETLPNGSVIVQTELFRFPGYVDDHIIAQFTPESKDDIQKEELVGIIKMKKNTTNMTMNIPKHVNAEMFKSEIKRKLYHNTSNHILKSITRYDVAIYRFFNYNYHNNWKAAIIKNTLAYIDQWLMLYALDTRHMQQKQQYLGYAFSANTHDTNKFR